MSDLKEIKRRINDKDKIKFLLEQIGCQYIKSEQMGTLITAQLPPKFNSHNKRAVQVRLSDGLTSHIRNRDFHGDIFDLVAYIHFEKDDTRKYLTQAKNFICKLFGLNEFLSGDSGIIVKDYTACLKRILDEENEPPQNTVLPESILKQYYPFGRPLPYKEWIDEGISYDTQVFYGVGFDLESKRIIFPIRNKEGQLVGVKGRILRDEDDDRKYLYLYPCNINWEWFNLYFAKEHILECKRVYIFEAEKSSMKAFTFEVYNTLAIGASDVSLEKARILLDEIGPDTEIVLCYDKDKTKKEIKKYAQAFVDFDKVYAMYDVDNLLQKKDAPVDRGFDTWNYLVKHNIYELRL